MPSLNSREQDRGQSSRDGGCQVRLLGKRPHVFCQSELCGRHTGDTWLIQKSRTEAPQSPWGSGTQSGRIFRVAQAWDLEHPKYCPAKRQRAASVTAGPLPTLGVCFVRDRRCGHPRMLHFTLFLAWEGGPWSRYMQGV